MNYLIDPSIANGYMTKIGESGGVNCGVHVECKQTYNNHCAVYFCLSQGCETYCGAYACVPTKASPMNL